ncbi:unnamed protein product [Arabidopsis halleri]
MAVPACLVSMCFFLSTFIIYNIKTTKRKRKKSFQRHPKLTQIHTLVSVTLRFLVNVILILTSLLLFKSS